MSYVPPTPEEVRAVLAALDLTGARAAELAALDGGSRTIRKYTGGKDPRTVSFALLHTLVYRACRLDISPQAWREELLARAAADPGAVDPQPLRALCLAPDAAAERGDA